MLQPDVLDEVFAVDQFDGIRSDRKRLSKIAPNSLPMSFEVDIRPARDDVGATSEMKSLFALEP